MPEISPVELQAQQMLKTQIGDMVFTIALLRAENESLKAQLRQQDAGG